MRRFWKFLFISLQKKIIPGSYFKAGKYEWILAGWKGLSRAVFCLAGGTQHLGGAFEPSKVNLSCQFPHLAKIQEIKSISKPRLPIEIYTVCQNLSTEDSNKDSTKWNGSTREKTRAGIQERWGFQWSCYCAQTVPASFSFSLILPDSTWLW